MNGWGEFGQARQRAAHETAGVNGIDSGTEDVLKIVAKLGEGKIQ